MKVERKVLESIRDQLIEIRKHEDTEYSIELEISSVITFINEQLELKPKSRGWHGLDEKPSWNGHFLVELENGDRVVVYCCAQSKVWFSDNDSKVKRWKELG